MDYVFNKMPHLRKSPDPESIALSEELAAHIRNNMSNKRVLFFGDTNHLTPRLVSVAFSPAVLSALVDIGIKDIFVERTVSDIHRIRAVQSGLITPLEYVLLEVPKYNDLDHIPAYIREEQGLYFAQGLVFAAKNNIRVHPEDRSNGFFADKNKQKQYLYLIQEKERLWLQYVLKNRDYFNNPEGVINNFIEQNSARYAKKNIDLECLRPQNQPRHTPWKIIHEIWEMDNAKTIPDLSNFNKKITQIFQQNTARMIQDRQKLDAALCADFNRQTRNGKFAIYYGAAHFRNQNGGFVKALNPDDTGVIHLWDAVSDMELYDRTIVLNNGNTTTTWDDHIRSDDLSAVLKGGIIVPTANFMPR